MSRRAPSLRRVERERALQVRPRRSRPAPWRAPRAPCDARPRSGSGISLSRNARSTPSGCAPTNCDTACAATKTRSTYGIERTLNCAESSGLSSEFTFTSFQRPAVLALELLEQRARAPCRARTTAPRNRPARAPRARPRSRRVRRRRGWHRSCNNRCRLAAFGSALYQAPRKFKIPCRCHPRPEPPRRPHRDRRARRRRAAHGARASAAAASACSRRR